MRQLGWVLSEMLFGKALAIPDFPESKTICGIGLSDPSELEIPLKQKVTYTNTFYDGEPRLDISDIPSDLEGTFDFVICSEVFEHVAPPIEQSFLNLRRLLKPGGCAVFSVPYKPDGDTIEHFPDLHNFRVDYDDRGPYLVNYTKSGVMQIRRDIQFHLGRGATLEMRVFSHLGLLKNFTDSNFCDIKVWDQPFFEFGIYMTEGWGLPWSAIAK
jgi:SAM-dependent methyltransferase